MGQSRLRLPPNHIIFAQGDDADAVFYIENGWVKLSVVAPNGREAVATPCGAGEYFGTRSLLEQPRTSTAATLTDCSLIRVTASAFIRLLHDSPGFAEMFTIYLVRRSLSDNENLVFYLTASAEQRLAGTLLRLANLGSGENPGAIPTPINQALLAAMIGATRSQVSVSMNKFRRQGLIDYDRFGSVSVRNPLRLGALLKPGSLPDSIGSPSY